MTPPRERLANNIAGAMDGVSDQVAEQCWTYWGKVDENLRDRVKEIFTGK